MPNQDHANGGSGMALTRVAIQRPLFTLMVILAVVVLGLVSATRLGVDLLPSVNIPVVTVSITYPGAGPEVVEQLVTKPVEDAVAGMPGLDSIRSVSSEGVSAVIVTFKDNVNADVAAIDVEKRVNAIRAQLPQDILPPSIIKADINAQAVMSLAVWGDRPPEQLYRLADEKIRPRLEQINGVGRVSLIGGRQREIQVKADPAKLRAYGLTLPQLSAVIAQENLNLPGGRIEQQGREVNLRVDTRLGGVKDIEDLAVTVMPNGTVVRVSDVATVEEGLKEQRTITRTNGKDTVLISVSKQSSANIVQVTDSIRKQLNTIRSTLPQDVQFEIVYDSSTFIRNSVNDVQRELQLAVLLTALVLLVFLHSWRSTFIVLLAIPTSLIATLAVMAFLGFTLNIMSLLGLALTVGILVDDSIVVLENIFRWLSRGLNPRAAALQGRSEIGLAAIAITFVDVVVFAPFAFLTGTTGGFFKQFGLVIVVATLFSLLVSFTLTPLLASRLLGPEHEHGRGPLAAFGRWWDRWFAALERRYRVALRWALQHRPVVILSGIAAFIISLAIPAAGLIGANFIPELDQSYFSLVAEMPPGTSLGTTSAVASRLEAGLLKIPEVKTVLTVVGQGTSQITQQSNVARLDVVLVSPRERHRKPPEIAAEAVRLGEGIAGLKVRAALPSAGPGGLQQPIQVNVYGDDLGTLTRLAAQVERSLAQVAGLSDITNSGTAGSPELVVHVDRQRAADFGLSSQAVAGTLRTAYAGTVATQLRKEGQSAVDVRVLGADADRASLDSVGQLPLLSPSRGTTFSLGQLAQFTTQDGPAQINRLNRQRVLTIGANIEGRALNEVSADIRKVIQSIDVPAGYRISLGGQSEAQGEAFGQLFFALGLSVLLTYMLLVGLYESLLYPLVIMLALPLSVVGAILALLVTRETVNIFSIVGLIQLFGLVGKNGILLVDYTNTLRRRGLSREEALLEAGPTRLRPILMTTATIVIALLPVALKLGEGSELRAPVALVVMGGMLSSTLLTLLFVPASYTYFDSLQNFILRLFQRSAPAAGSGSGEARWEWQNEPVTAPVPLALPSGRGNETRSDLPAYRSPQD